MIRLLEKAIKTRPWRAQRDGHGRLKPPVLGSEQRPKVHLRQSDAIAAAYLRVAHIYMLISMPTETSTIFGAFQAIALSLIEAGASFVPSDKVMIMEKFASEIFDAPHGSHHVASHKEFTQLCESRMTDQTFRHCSHCDQ